MAQSTVPVKKIFTGTILIPKFTNFNPAVATSLKASLQLHPRHYEELKSSPPGPHTLKKMFT
jgi:hypothetical protein